MTTSPGPTGKPQALFVSNPLYGHLGPLLRQGEELVRRGWDVAVATTEEGQVHVERRPSGVSFVNLGPVGIPLEEQQRMVERVSAEPDVIKGLLEIVGGFERGWPVLYDGINAAVARLKPKVLVADFATTAGLDVADATGVALVVNNADILPVLPAALLPPANHVPALFSGKRQSDLRAWDRWLAPVARTTARWGVSLTIGRVQNRCRRTRGLPPIDVNSRLIGQTILVNSAFGFEYERPLSPGIHLVGPMLDPDEPPLTDEEQRWLADGPPVVFVNLGTVAAPPPEQVQKLAAGLASSQFRVLWVVRPPTFGHLPPTLAANVRVVPWVSSQLHVLAHANVRAFVSHGGTNSVQESLWAGTPVVVFPMFAAQRDVGLRAVDAGVGLLLDKVRFTPEELRASVERVLAEDAFRLATAPIRKRFDEAGGVRRAADLIEQRAGVARGASH